MRKKGSIVLALGLLVFLLGRIGLQAQNMDALGTFTPYSMFGVGDLVRPGTSLNRGMGGIGVGLRDNRFINYLNPASASARTPCLSCWTLGLCKGTRKYGLNPAHRLITH